MVEYSPEILFSRKESAMSHNFKKRIASNSYTEIIPYYPYGKREGGWRDGMVTGFY